ncbi:hypothetical protein G7046_g8540 [Stylonectria norvegica]|nr:hypothetical protein G7046_g8540 [Stylonectria norvegica]
MPYFKTSQEWLEKSTALLEARPATTRITTKYSIKSAPPRPAKAEDDAASAPAAKPPRGTLTIKTFDPVSGVTLKYRTTKAAEVSRLIYSSLGKLGRNMAAVPEAPEELMPDAPAEEDVKPVVVQASQPPTQQGGGGKKKKKGKK